MLLHTALHVFIYKRDRGMNGYLSGDQVVLIAESLVKRVFTAGLCGHCFPVGYLYGAQIHFNLILL